jgi:pyruvate,orthophosphate dikinase
MKASRGILTQEGGKTSHAAVVARGFGKPCIVGCRALRVDEAARCVSVGGTKIYEGDYITIDGSSGRVILGEAPMVMPKFTAEMKTLLKWADQRRKLGVRANADNPEDASRAYEYGAEGIGLCRTEHMFLGDRRPLVQEMILAPTEKHRRKALEKLRPLQKADFIGIFKAMKGNPVTIRLIDPPLHEFLETLDSIMLKVAALRVLAMSGDPKVLDELRETEKLLASIQQMHEANPMMGLRGCRLSIVFPEIVEMQVAAILEAAAACVKKKIPAKPEIMIPLVGHVNEIIFLREKLEAVAAEVMTRLKVKIDYKFGTMIEVPRGALCAAEIAAYAEFFSFGTNDLTQMTFGYSRDDAEGKFISTYLNKKILIDNPFETLDTVGVGRLVKIAVNEGRRVKPDLKIGICGEHGGDPESIRFCHEAGLDYVSCSPFRVPIARLAAAQANIAAKQDKDR